ncbi:MAG: asparaginase, partial [Pseudomonadota bacterium]
EGQGTARRQNDSHLHLSQSMNDTPIRSDAADPRKTPAYKSKRRTVLVTPQPIGHMISPDQKPPKTSGRAVVKTGAEGVYVAVIPEKRLGVALKITDGTTRASECAIAAILVKLGVLNPDHPAAKLVMTPPVKNWDGLVTGQIRPAATLQ